MELLEFVRRPLEPGRGPRIGGRHGDLYGLLVHIQTEVDMEADVGPVLR